MIDDASVFPSQLLTVESLRRPVESTRCPTRLQTDSTVPGACAIPSAVSDAVSDADPNATLRFLMHRVDSTGDHRRRVRKSHGQVQ